MPNNALLFRLGFLDRYMIQEPESGRKMCLYWFTPQHPSRECLNAA